MESNVFSELILALNCAVNNLEFGLDVEDYLIGEFVSDNLNLLL